MGTVVQASPNSLGEITGAPGYVKLASADDQTVRWVSDRKSLRPATLSVSAMSNPYHPSFSTNPEFQRTYKQEFQRKLEAVTAREFKWLRDEELQVGTQTIPVFAYTYAAASGAKLRGYSLLLPGDATASYVVDYSGLEVEARIGWKPWLALLKKQLSVVPAGERR